MGKMTNTTLVVNVFVCLCMYVYMCACTHLVVSLHARAHAFTHACREGGREGGREVQAGRTVICCTPSR